MKERFEAIRKGVDAVQQTYETKIHSGDNIHDFKGHMGMTRGGVS